MSSIFLLSDSGKFTAETPEERYMIIQNEIDNAVQTEVSKILQEKASTRSIQQDSFDMSLVRKANDVDERNISGGKHLDDQHGFDLQPIKDILIQSQLDVNKQEEETLNAKKKSRIKNASVKQKSQSINKKKSIVQSPSFERATVSSLRSMV